MACIYFTHDLSAARAIRFQAYARSKGEHSKDMRNVRSWPRGALRKAGTSNSAARGRIRRGLDPE
jgi:hypothetical protein